MPTDSDPTNSASVIVTTKALKEILSQRWRNLSHLFTDENISNAVLQVIREDKLDSDGNYKPSARYLQTSSYDPVLRVEIKPDLFLIYDEIIRATNNF